MSSVKGGLSSTAVVDGGEESNGEERALELVPDATGVEQAVSESFSEEETVSSSFTCGGCSRGVDSVSLSSIASVETTRLAECIPWGIGGVLVEVVSGKLLVGTVGSFSLTFRLGSFCSA